MRLLFLANTCPLPANNGLTLRSSSVLRALHDLGHEILLLSFVETELSGETRSELGELCTRVRLIKAEFGNVSSAGKYWDRLKKLFSRSPYGLLRYRSSAMKAALGDLLTSERFDAILCDTIDSVIHLPARTTIPVIVNNHNVEHLILERYLAHERNLAKQIYARIEAIKLKRWEREACSRADIVWVCSRFDQDLLQELCPGIRFQVVPNAIDLKSYVPGDESEEQEPVVLYTGGMDWYPNRDAVEFFVGQILSQLEKLAPSMKFVVAGRSPDEEFRRRYERKNVVFTGTVPDMRPEILRAAVCVVPLRIGSGTRLKILEAGALAKPVVSTTLGAEGLEFVPEQEILIADDPLTFARMVSELLSDPNRRTQLGLAARKRVEASYGFDSLRRAIEGSLETSMSMGLVSAEAEKSAACVVAQ